MTAPSARSSRNSTAPRRMLPQKGRLLPRMSRQSVTLAPRRAFSSNFSSASARARETSLVTVPRGAGVRRSAASGAAACATGAGAAALPFAAWVAFGAAAGAAAVGAVFLAATGAPASLRPEASTLRGILAPAAIGWAIGFAPAGMPAALNCGAGALNEGGCAALLVLACRWLAVAMTVSWDVSTGAATGCTDCSATCVGEGLTKAWPSVCFKSSSCSTNSRSYWSVASCTMPAIMSSVRSGSACSSHPSGKPACISRGFTWPNRPSSNSRRPSATLEILDVTISSASARASARPTNAWARRRKFERRIGALFGDAAANSRRVRRYSGLSGAASRSVHPAGIPASFKR